MADGYISQIKTPDNKVYLLKDSESVRRDSELLTTNSFAPASLRGPYISKIDNAFYAADKRWQITATNLSYGGVEALFDGNYESQARISGTDAAVITMDFDPEHTNVAEKNKYFPGYPYGYILISFYSPAGPTSISGRVYCNYSAQGIGWHDLTFSPISDNTTYNIVYRSAHQGYYNMAVLEITINGNTSNSYGYTAITQIEMHLDRPYSRLTPFLSKYGDETLYYNLTAPKFIGALQGNADTATKLQTARNLWGNSFNGTAAIDGSITMGSAKAIKFAASAGDTATSTPTALTYGRLQAYGTLCINANTDNSGTEYVILTAGKGMSSSGADGLEVGSTTLKFLGTDVVRNSGSWDISITGNAASATSANYINLYEARGTTTTLNKVANYIGAGKMFHLVASSSTDTTDNGKTPTDANILQMNWDNNGGYDAQLGIATGANRMYFRSRPSQKIAWDEVAHAPVGAGVGSATQPVYMTSEGVITSITAVGAAYGGTGKTTLKDSANALINALDTGSSALTADDYVITQYVGGGTTTTTYHRRPASQVVNGTLVKAALGTVGTTAKKFLKDTGNWVQVDWEDLTGKPTTETLRDTLFPVTTYTKTVTLTTEWQDVGITGTDLNLDGTYIIQLYLRSIGTDTLNSYSERYSGIMSWFTGMTNSSNADEIVLHRAGHAPNNNCIYLRVQRSSATATPNTLRLQIKASKNTAVEATLKFKFRWILD